MKTNKNANKTAALLLLCIAGVCALLLCLSQIGASGSTADIWVDGEIVQTVPLDKNTTFSITTDTGHTVSFEVNGGRIRFTSSDCPDKICVNTGYISHGTETAICMPNRISVTINE